VTTQIHRFDPREASTEDLVAYHAMRVAAVAVDTPTAPPLTYEAAIGFIQNPPIEYGECRYWNAYRDDRLVGSVQVAFPANQNSQLVMTNVIVHPDVRRHGIGTDLLRATMSSVLTEQRSAVIGAGMDVDSPGARWVESLGFHITMRTVMQQLLIGAVPVETWDVAVPSGYRLERWMGSTPDDLIASYAVARPAIRDAPLGETSFEETDWTVDSIRAAERELAAQGVEERVVVAIDSATNSVVGVTGLLVRPFRRTFGYQNDTSVLGSHRGHGLGRTMKAAMMRWTVSERPELERIFTTTSADNSHMIAVNLSIGYSTERRLIWTETTAEQLAARLTVAVGF
jgi:mycothiol synthase